jgi:hypothetical protein
MLPDERALTFKTSQLIDPVKETETGAIELLVVTAATGRCWLSAACISAAAPGKPGAEDRLIDAA